MEEHGRGEGGAGGVDGGQKEYGGDEGRGGGRRREV